MSYNIQDRISITISFEGLEYPLSKFNVLNFLHISSNVRMLLPQFHMSLTDQSGILAQMGIKDSSKVTITIAAIGPDAVSKTYNFRVYSFKNALTGTGMQWEMDGFLDSIPYWFTTTADGIRGTSNEVLEQIAGVCGLQYEGTVTNDSQLWLPQNRIWGEFARRIVARGYANDKSCMKSVVTKEGILRYKDINNLPDANYSLLQGEMKEGWLPIVDHRPISDAGMNNALTGYMATRRQQSTVGTSDQQQFSELAFQPDSRTPLLDMETRSKVGRGRQQYSPIDVGNVHPAYEQAAYQNVRYGNLYNLAIECLSTFPTPLQVLDKFNFSSQLLGGEANNVTNGTYVQTGHVIFIQGINYYEKIIGVRHGTNIVRQQ